MKYYRIKRHDITDCGATCGVRAVGGAIVNGIKIQFK